VKENCVLCSVGRLWIESGFDSSSIANENETSVGNDDGVRIPEIPEDTYIHVKFRI
jgi:hypothetical protein